MTWTCLPVRLNSTVCFNPVIITVTVPITAAKPLATKTLHDCSVQCSCIHTYAHRNPRATGRLGDASLPRSRDKDATVAYWNVTSSHLHRQVGACRMNSAGDLFGLLYGKRFGSEMAWNIMMEGDKAGDGSGYRKKLWRVTYTEANGGGMCEGDGMGRGLVEVKILCFRWLSPCFKLIQKRFPRLA